MPPLLAALRYVPVAMLTALIPRWSSTHGGAADFATPRVAAAVIATAVAFTTRNTLGTLGAGMLALWLLQWAFG
jgi:branched-subunit amino acid transport protein